MADGGRVGKVGRSDTQQIYISPILRGFDFHDRQFRPIVRRNTPPACAPIARHRVYVCAGAKDILDNSPPEEKTGLVILALGGASWLVLVVWMCALSRAAGRADHGELLKGTEGGRREPPASPKGGTAREHPPSMLSRRHGLAGGAPIPGDLPAARCGRERRTAGRSVHARRSRGLRGWTQQRAGPR
jgi:hypothetical protein